MLADTILITALISSAAVAAIPSSFKRDETADFEKCRDDCFNNIDAVAACAKDADPTTCACNVDPSNDFKSLKCVFDCLDQVGQKTPFPYSRLNTQAGVQNIPAKCGGSSSPPPKNSGTIASQFNVPSCAKDCVTAENIPDCKDQLTDTKCVCNAIDNVATPGPSAFSMTKCVLDKCNEQDGTTAIIQLGVDCGDWTANLDASKFQYPLNKLKMAFDANSNSTNTSSSSSSSSGAATSPNTASSAGAAPTDSSKKNSAPGRRTQSLSLASGAIALGWTLL